MTIAEGPATNGRVARLACSQSPRPQLKRLPCGLLLVTPQQKESADEHDLPGARQP